MAGRALMGAVRLSWGGVVGVGCLSGSGAGCWSVLSVDWAAVGGVELAAGVW